MPVADEVKEVGFLLKDATYFGKNHFHLPQRLYSSCDKHGTFCSGHLQASTQKAHLDLPLQQATRIDTVRPISRSRLFKG